MFSTIVAMLPTCFLATRRALVITSAAVSLVGWLGWAQAAPFIRPIPIPRIKVTPPHQYLPSGIPPSFRDLIEQPPHDLIRLPPRDLTQRPFGDLIPPPPQDELPRVTGEKETTGHGPADSPPLIKGEKKVAGPDSLNVPPFKGSPDAFRNRSLQLDLSLAQSAFSIRSARVDLLLAQSAQSSGGYFEVLHVTRVEDPAHSSLYYVQSHGSPPKLIDQAQGLVDEANRIGAATTARSVYIFVDGPSPLKDVRALELSLRNLQRRVQIPLAVAREPLALAIGAGGLGFTTYDLMTPVQGPATIRRQGSVYTSSEGYHFQEVMLNSRLGDISLSIVASSRAWIEHFYRVLARLFSKPENYEALSYLAIVQEGRMQLSRELGITLDQVDKELGVNIGNSQIAAWPDTGTDAWLAIAITGAP